MRFITLFEKYDHWSEGTWVIHTALRVWSTLTVDASGNVIPEPRYRDNSIASASSQIEYQSPEQKKQWNELTHNFYRRIMKRAEKYEDTFSTENINTIREYLSAASKDARMQSAKIPENTIVTRIEHLYHVNEQRDGIRVAGYMLQLDQASALSFLENLSVYWAANLSIPEDSDPPLERGRYLYLLAEQME